MMTNQDTVKWGTLSAVTLVLIAVITFGTKSINAYAEFMGKQRDIVRDVNDLREGQQEILRKIDGLSPATYPKR